jgi:hypothetical protein
MQQASTSRIKQALDNMGTKDRGLIKVLAISFSQTGQASAIVDLFIAPFTGWDIDRVEIKMEKSFPFPWPMADFIAAMPDSVSEKAEKIQPINYKHTQYDIVIIGYQPWFLSPSIPASSLLQDAGFLSRIKGAWVAEIIGARNMWVNAHKSIASRIISAGGLHAGFIPFCDKAPNLVSAYTIVQWMTTGRKEKTLGILPAPGVPPSDMQKASHWGSIFRKGYETDNRALFQAEACKQNGIFLPQLIYFIEQKGKKIFKLWASIINKLGNTPRRKNIALKAFKYYLIAALFIVSPIVSPIYLIVYYLFQKKSGDKARAKICSNSDFI